MAKIVITPKALGSGGSEAIGLGYLSTDVMANRLLRADAGDILEQGEDECEPLLNLYYILGIIKKGA